MPPPSWEGKRDALIAGGERGGAVDEDEDEEGVGSCSCLAGVRTKAGTTVQSSWLACSGVTVEGGENSTTSLSADSDAAMSLLLSQRREPDWTMCRRVCCFAKDMDTNRLGR